MDDRFKKRFHIATNTIAAKTTPFWQIIKVVVVSDLPSIATGAILFIIFVIIGLIIKWIVCSRANSNTHKKPVKILIGKSLRLLFIILGIIVGLGTTGVNTSSLVTSLRLTGFALSFAMKDVLTNLIAGSMIILNDRLKVGD